MKPHPNDPKGEAGSKKCPLHLLPTEPLRETAVAMKHGADKYGRFNWRQTKVLASVYHGAILRHLFAWADGEDDDPESGAPHLAHIAANAMILRDALKSGSLIDDRSASEVKAPEEPGSELPPGVPPLPPGTRYGGRLRDYEGAVFGYTFYEQLDKCWDRKPAMWGASRFPEFDSADWHIAIPL